MASNRDWITHDIKNRLTVARGFTQLLRKGRAKGKPQLQEDYLEMIDTALDDAMGLLEKFEGSDSERKNRD